jgi:hypothetical protein
VQRCIRGEAIRERAESHAGKQSDEARHDIHEDSIPAETAASFLL